MSRNRLVYTPERVHAMANHMRDVLAKARADLVAMHDRHVRELQDLRREVAELREVMLLVTTTLRQTAESDVRTLRRQLEVALARIERDPAKPLH